jgi:asparagine synthetase B (glutamine-hydrolysing)
MIQRFLMHLCAAELGHRVVFDGLGGDMITSLPAGYPAFLAVNGQLGTAIREAFLQWNNFHNRETPVWRPIASALWPLITYKGLREKRRSRAQKRFLADEMKLNLIRPEFAEAVGLEERFERYSSTLYRCSLEHNRSSGLRAAHVERVRVPYLTAACECGERVAAVGGVEARHPLLDREFTEFCLRLPWDHLSRNGWAKYGLRRLAAEVVPHKIAWRRDYGGLDWQYQARWTKSNRQMIIDQLMSDSRQLSDWIDWPVFSKRLQRAKIESDEMIDYISGRLVCLQIWTSRHFQ